MCVLNTWSNEMKIWATKETSETRRGNFFFFSFLFGVLSSVLGFDVNVVYASLIIGRGHKRREDRSLRWNFVNCWARGSCGYMAQQNCRWWDPCSESTAKALAWENKSNSQKNNKSTHNKHLGEKCYKFTIFSNQNSSLSLWVLSLRLVNVFAVISCGEGNYAIQS